MDNRKLWGPLIKAAAGLSRDRKAALYHAFYFLDTQDAAATVSAYVEVYGLQGYNVAEELPSNWFNRIIENRAGCVYLGGVFYPVFLTVNI